MSDASPIVRYIVRRPGNTSWCETTEEANARRERAYANAQVAHGHRIYIEHEDGSITETE